MFNEVSDDNKRILVIAPHADDEVLGAGETIIRAVSSGWDVEVLFATIAGYQSFVTTEESSDNERYAETKKAQELLGVNAFDCFPERLSQQFKLDSLPQCELIQTIETAIERIRPSVVIMPCRGHYHQDHRSVADACISALRLAPDGRLNFVPIVLAYGHAAAGWGGSQYQFEAGFYVDISDVIDQKLDALAAYKSLLCAYPIRAVLIK